MELIKQKGKTTGLINRLRIRIGVPERSKGFWMSDVVETLEVGLSRVEGSPIICG